MSLLVSNLSELQASSRAVAVVEPRAKDKQELRHNYLLLYRKPRAARGLVRSQMHVLLNQILRINRKQRGMISSLTNRQHEREVRDDAEEHFLFQPVGPFFTLPFIVCKICAYVDSIVSQESPYV
jgi:hypothetical protein